MRLYWWREGCQGWSVPNWGDRMNWTILHYLGIDADWAPADEADLILLGSVLEHLSPAFTGTVCGAGKLHGEYRTDLSNANVLALRGKLTAELVDGLKHQVVLGDPALLLPTWFRQRPAIYELGIVPHWSDRELWRRFRYDKLIDPTNHPEQVIEEITSCKRIISSSLHGVVVADAFGIPRRAELFPDAFGRPHHEGGDFKFRDYSSIWSDPDPHFGEFWRPPHKELEAVQKGLRGALSEAVGVDIHPLVPAPPPPPPPPQKRSWLPCWRRRSPQVSMIVPFRDDNEQRAEVWAWLKEYWTDNLPSSTEIVVGHDSGVPFSKANAVNNAARQARGEILIIMDADGYTSCTALDKCVTDIQNALAANQRMWYMPYDKLYRLNQTYTNTLMLTDPSWPYAVPSPPPNDWLEGGLDPSGGRSTHYGHQYGAMCTVVPREAFWMVGGMDPRFRGWGSEDVSFLRALDTLYCQHQVATNDMIHLWHERPGTNWLTRRWVGQPFSMNSRLAQRYQWATGEPSFMKGLADEHPLPPRRCSWLSRFCPT